MKADDGLYNIKELKTDGLTISAVVTFNKDHWIYGVHFPQYPVTPGAIILQVAEDLLCMGTGEDYKMVGSKNVRFYNIIAPDGREVYFKMSYRKLAENWIEIGKNVDINAAGPSLLSRMLSVNCDVSDKSGDTSFAKISAVYRRY